MPKGDDITERLRRMYVQHGTNYVQEAADTIDRLREKVAQLERGEYICKRCGLRKDGERPKGDF